MMTKYQYPDSEDFLTISFISKLEKSGVYWQESEKAINEFIIEYLRNKGDNQMQAFLDAGCGKGRLIEVFEKYFETGLAIEPDLSRFNHTLRLLSDKGLTHKIEAINIAAESYKSQRVFDFIICSHVIQHIHSNKVMPLMRNLRNHLSENGLIALTSCNSTLGNDYYGKNYLENEIPVRKVINEEEFNSLIEAKDCLPIHFFDSDKLISELESSGLNTVAFKVFHVSREEREMLKVDNIDEYVNSSPDLQKKYGVDMCLLLEKI